MFRVSGMFHLKYQEVGLSTEIGTGFSFERERPFLLATSHSFLPAFVFFIQTSFQLWL